MLWHINLHGLFNAKAIPVEELGNKRVHAFPKDIRLNVNVIE